jgi:hypothetical protein
VLLFLGRKFVFFDRNFSRLILNSVILVELFISNTCKSFRVFSPYDIRFSCLLQVSEPFPCVGTLNCILVSLDTSEHVSV